MDDAHAVGVLGPNGRGVFDRSFKLNKSLFPFSQVRYFRPSVFFFSSSFVPFLFLSFHRSTLKFSGFQLLIQRPSLFQTLLLLLLSSLLAFRRRIPRGQVMKIVCCAGTSSSIYGNGLGGSEIK